MSVLVVSSDFAVLATVREQLHDERIYLATDDASAVETATRRQPEAIFVLVTPRNVGRVTKQLRSACSSAHVVAVMKVPVMARTRSRVAQDAAQAAGAAGYIPMESLKLSTRAMMDKIREYQLAVCK